MGAAAVREGYALPDGGRTVDREILKPVAHGVLHLLGYDHPNEKRIAEMRRIENHHVRAAVDGR